MCKTTILIFLAESCRIARSRSSSQACNPRCTPFDRLFIDVSASGEAASPTRRSEASIQTAAMADTSLFNIRPSDLTLQAVLANDAPGVTLYQADWQRGKRVIKVCQTSQCLLRSSVASGQRAAACAMQVAVKRLHTSSATAAVETNFLKEVQALQLASASCYQACHILGCCKLERDACIVTCLYPKSAAKRLKDSQGWCCWLSTSPIHACFFIHI